MSGKNWRKILTGFVLLLALLLAFQNCGDVKLKSLEMLSLNTTTSTTTIEATTTTSEVTTTSNPVTTTTDPLTGIIIPGPPAPQFPNEPNLTPDTAGIHAGLWFYNLTTTPPSCADGDDDGLPVKLVQGWENASFSSNGEIIDPDYVDLSNPSIVNWYTPDQLAGLATNTRIADHDIRFMRPQGAAIYSFRIKTPPVSARLNISVTDQYNNVFTHTLLGCDVFGPCAQTPVAEFVSISTEPCVFANSNSKKLNCPFDASAGWGIVLPSDPYRVLRSQDTPPGNPCDLRANSYYYVNVKFRWPVIDPGIISGNNYRTVMRITADKR